MDQLALHHEELTRVLDTYHLPTYEIYAAINRIVDRVDQYLTHGTYVGLQVKGVIKYLQYDQDDRDDPINILARILATDYSHHLSSNVIHIKIFRLYSGHYYLSIKQGEESYGQFIVNHDLEDELDLSPDAFFEYLVALYLVSQGRIIQLKVGEDQGESRLDLLLKQATQLVEGVDLHSIYNHDDEEEDIPELTQRGGLSNLLSRVHLPK